MVEQALAVAIIDTKVVETMLLVPCVVRYAVFEGCCDRLNQQIDKSTNPQMRESTDRSFTSEEGRRIIT